MSSVPEGVKGREPPAKGCRLRLPTRSAVAWLRSHAQGRLHPWIYGECVARDRGTPLRGLGSRLPMWRPERPTNVTQDMN